MAGDIPPAGGAGIATEEGDIDVTLPRSRERASYALAPGTMLDGVYRIEGLIGRGAMGAVYLAEHMTLGKQFAVKVVGSPGDMAPSDSAVQRLVREARLASAIEHDNIVNVTHLGVTPEGLPFAVMELLRGENLRQHHLRVSGGDPARTQPLDDDLVRSVVSEVLSALVAAHDSGIVHRDLKPDNIFLADKRDKCVAKVVDFGMSKVIAETKNVRLTKSGQILGTPLYMSPEQGKNTAEIDERSDLYSMGVIIYEMLTGHVPFPAETIYECIFKHISEAPPPLGKRRPDLPEAVVLVVHRALAKDPDERFQSAREFLDAWEASWAEALCGDTLTSTNRTPTGEPSEQVAVEPTRPPVGTLASDESKSAIAVPHRSTAPRTLFFALGAVVVAIAGWVLVFGDGDPETAESSSAASRAAVEAEPLQVRTAPAPIAPETGVQLLAPKDEPLAARVVTVASRPAAASVRVGDERLGATPLEVTIPEGEQAVTVHLERPGYLPSEVQLDREGPEEVEAVLVPRPARPERPSLAPR